MLFETPGASQSTLPPPKHGDIVAVKLSQIPKVRAAAFAQYLSVVSEYERYLFAKEQVLRDLAKPLGLNDTISSPTRGFASMEILVEALPRRRSGKGNLAIVPLSTIPSVYFHSNFRLENPRTFDIVSDHSDVIKPAITSQNMTSLLSQRKALATNAILQEKLSWYMDTVEMHLIFSISTASSSFFAALGDLRELHSEAAESVNKIQALRHELVRLDKEQAVKGLDIIRFRRRRGNLTKLNQAVMLVQNIILGLRRVEKSLENSFIEDALEATEETEKLFSGIGINRGSFNLGCVGSLFAISADLDHLRHRVGKAFEVQFVDCLLTDLREHIAKVPATETLQQWAKTFQREQYQRAAFIKHSKLEPPPRSPPGYARLTLTLRAALVKHLDGLQRAKHVGAAVQAYRDAVVREAKSLIRKQLPCDDDAESVMSSVSRLSHVGGPRSSTQDKSQALTRDLQALGPVDSEDLFVRIYTRVSELVRRLGTQQKMLLDVTMGIGEVGVGGMLSPRLEQGSFILADVNGQEKMPTSEIQTAGMDITDLISSAIETSLSYIVKIIKVRTEPITRYSSDMFLRYFTLNRLFLQECESLSVRFGSSMQNSISFQIKEFIKAYQEQRIRALADGLEKDKWVAKEFDGSRQNGIERIIASATSDPDDWLSSTHLWAISEQLSHVDPHAKILIESTRNSRNGAWPEGVKRYTHAYVGAHKFILPESGLLVLCEIESYLRLVTTLPDSLVPELAMSLIDFLKLFNSRTFQLILGAGATRSAGLKSITTKHLAMASQALSIMVTLIPYIRECVRRHTAVGQGSAVIAEFDKLKRTTQEYKTEIHDKLASIMSDRATSHVKTMKKIVWDEPCHSDGPYYMETLCRETTVLYKVLNRHLPPEELLSILKPVFMDYRVKLAEGFCTGRVISEAGKQRYIYIIS